MGRGTLRIYLGAAPGVGKTYAMLSEGHRRRQRGTDVVVGFVETHGRPRTAALVEGLEVVPRRRITYRGATFTEMDVDAVLARRPQVALVDELAHTNVPGSRNAKRWQDVEELLDAGIHVISTLNIQHLESLNDVVEQITGVPQRETIPDEVVRRADQIELVDMTPEALRRRLAHGNVYAPEKIDAALSNYFRVGNLTALRELALLWVADRVDEGLRRYRAEHHIDRPWPARERVVVGLSGGPEGETVIRRAARIAARGSGGELMAVYVARSDGLTGASPKTLARQRELVENLGGSFHTVVGDDVPTALLQFAKGVNATQLVLGISRRKRHLFSPGVGNTVARLADEIDVHIVPHEKAGRGLRLLPERREALSRLRRLWGWAAAVIGPPALTLLLALTRDMHSLPTDLLLFLALTVGVALLGGLWPALFCAVSGSLLLNFYFTPPIHRFTIAEPENLLALVVFVLVGVGVSSVVDLAARRTQQAARSQAEAEVLSGLARSVLSGKDALPALLNQLKETFGMRAVALLERADATGVWRCVGAVGDQPPTRPEDADVDVPISDDLALVLAGRVPSAGDRRVLEAFAAQAAVVLERQRLAAQAAEAHRLAEVDRTRTALLAAVSHDLRTPLASIKAAVSSLRANDVRWDPEDEAELLAAIEESADRLDALVGNLLDMSRLQTGTVTPVMRPVGLDEVVPAALAGVPAARVRLDVPESLPLVWADPGLLERVVANVVENAVQHSPPDQPVLIQAGAIQDRVELRVVDRGPGVPDEAKDRIFEPFQRLGDAPKGTGVGLGLAVARGFAEALGGSLTAEDTPGGGLTMVLALRAVVPYATAPDMAVRDREAG
ncbi:histidine kinase [Carbonactinospora thermoautotrophica]|nr:sensor histidine kinase KdpD [Carbonactinospora thermoautotrophica]MCX9190730.1 histidine kinase [Carbonactinospora thermoautotrophica]